MRIKGILKLIITWALDRINSTKIRSKALFVLGSLLRNNHENRMMFSQHTILIARESTPQPTLHRLLTLAFHSSCFSEKISSANSFINFLHENNESQLAIITTITPPPDSSQNSSLSDPHSGANSIGRQLLKSLQEGYKQPISSWIASWILSCVLCDNNDCKQLAQKIQISLEFPGETLLSLCMKLLRSNQAQVKQKSSDLLSQLSSIGFLRILSIWMFQFPSLITEFLSIPENLTFLIDLINQPDGNIHLQGFCALVIGFCFMFNENENPEDISNNRLALHGIICHRIGFDKFIQKIELLQSSKPFQNALHNDNNNEIISKLLDDPQLQQDPSSLLDYFLYDYDLIEFIKNSKEQLIKDLRSPNKRKADSIHKDKMKEKENQILLLNEKIKNLQLDLEKKNVLQSNENQFENQLNEALEKISILEEELESKEDALTNLSLAYNDLESHLNSLNNNNTGDNNTHGSVNQPNEPNNYKKLSTDLSNCEENIRNLNDENSKLNNTINELNAQIDQLKNELSLKNEQQEQNLIVDTSVNDNKNEEIQLLNEEIKNLKNTLEGKQKEIVLKSEGEIKAQNLLLSTQKRFQDLLKQLKDEKEKAAKFEKEKEEFAVLLAQAHEENDKLSKIQPADSSPTTDSNLQQQLQEWKDKYSQLQREHEDLLIMFVQNQKE